MRGRFAWIGAAVVLLAVGCVATVGTQDTWLDGYGIISYFRCGIWTSFDW
jgi:hypothetical protein